MSWAFNIPFKVERETTTTDPYLGHNVIRITVPSGGGTFYISNFYSQTASEIDWGDGTKSSHSGGGYTYNFASHEYVDGGEFIIQMADTVTDFGCSGNKDTTSVSRLWVNEVWGIWSLGRQYFHFNGCSNLVSAHGSPVYYPQFTDCSSLKTIPDFLSATTILGNDVFTNCSAIEEIGDIPLMTVFPNTQNCTSLKKVGSVQNITSIPNYSFKNVSSMISSGPWPSVPPSTPGYTGIPQSGEILIPSGSRAAYEADSIWAKAKSRFVEV